MTAGDTVTHWDGAKGRVLYVEESPSGPTVWLEVEWYTGSDARCHTWVELTALVTE